MRPRDAQAKKQQSATLPASSKTAGGTAPTTRHREGASGTKKTAKTTGKTGSSTQTKTYARSTNTISRGAGKFSCVDGLPCLPPCMENVLVSLFEWKEDTLMSFAYVIHCFMYSPSCI